MDADSPELPGGLPTDRRPFRWIDDPIADPFLLVSPFMAAGGRHGKRPTSSHFPHRRGFPEAITVPIDPEPVVLHASTLFAYRIVERRIRTMDVNRREFMQLTGAAAAAVSVSGLGFSLAPAKAHAQTLKISEAKETSTICCYCAVGCGAIVHTSLKGDGRVVNIEGDPDHVINRGALCSKGASLSQLVENDMRTTEPLYRAPNSTE
jgi:hypothetical protein